MASKRRTRKDNRLISFKIIEGEVYQYRDTHYKSNLNVTCTDNKWVQVVWDTGSLTMRLDKFNKLSKRKRDLLYDIR